MTPLHKGQLSVLRVRAGLTAAGLFVAVLVAERTWLHAFVPPPLARGAAAILLALAAFILPKRRYRSWGYLMAEEELHVQHGLWTRVRTIVPFGRVQHIDLAQGPIERQFGVATLILNTAGTRNSAVALPGLEHEEAVRMRDEIRSKIRQDLE